MSINNDQKVPQPRYSQFNKDKAKEQGLAMFTIDIDRRFMKDYDEGNGGSRVTTVGCCTREHYPHLHRAFLILQGVSLEQADKVFTEDMNALCKFLINEVVALERQKFEEDAKKREKVSE